MRYAAITGILVAGLSALPVFAACPVPAPGDTAAEIKANSDRVVCLQDELSENTTQRQLQMQLDAIDDRLRDLQLQRRFDNLPRPPVIVVQPPIIP